MKGREGATKEGLSCLMSAAEVGFLRRPSTTSQICSVLLRHLWREQRGRATYDSLEVAHEIIEGDEGQLRFEMGIFTQMATGVTVVCSQDLKYE